MTEPETDADGGMVVSERAIPGLVRRLVDAPREPLPAPPDADPSDKHEQARFFARLRSAHHRARSGEDN